MCDGACRGPSAIDEVCEQGDWSQQFIPNTGTPPRSVWKQLGLWCADFKGEFKLRNGHYCYPLTVTDHASRFLLLCEALEWTREDTAITRFEQMSSNGVCPPLSARTTAYRLPARIPLFNLSKLSVWWLRLGIGIERIKPSDPQQNGRHERMHLTLNRKPPDRLA